jgi:vacuolar protein sorting-associated protein 8
LTEPYELTLVDIVMMTLLERLDFSGLKLVYAEFALSRTSSGADEVGQAVSTCTTFLNSTRCSDDRIMVICQDELRCISIIGARRRISALEADGEWLEALAFALDHYENTVTSQEDRRRDPLARRDLSRHPEFSIAKSDEEEWIAALLIRYLNLAVENAPEIADHSSPFSANGSKIDLAHSHFQMLAGVCVEFCVATRRLDLLFGPIFRRFQSVGFVAVFLDVLEPYVLNDKLKYIAPEVMSLFVEHCRSTSGIATVERCLLHMDCTIMDFDSILSLLRGNEMYSALFYVSNQGLDDFVAPLEILLEKVFSEADSGGASLVHRRDGSLRNDFERLGYKALLYLQSCFAGTAFPQETAIEPEDRVNSVKVEVLQFLTKEKYSPSSYVKKPVNLLPVIGQRAQPFPYIRIILLVDPRGALETISMCIDSLRATTLRPKSSSDTIDDWVDGSTKPKHYSKAPDLQEIMFDLASILLPKSTGGPNVTLSDTSLLNARGAVEAFLDFAAKYIVNGSAHFEKSITFMILARVAKQYSTAAAVESRQLYQRKTMDILSALPRDSYDPDLVLATFKDSGMHRAALLLHQQVASSWHDAGDDDIQLRLRHFVSAIDCYAEDEDQVFRLEVFKYVRKECSGVAETSSKIQSTQPTSVRDALFSRLSVLVHLDALMTARLVAELFIDDLDRVILSLESRDGNSQFLFLQAIVSGDLVQADPVAGSVLNLSMEHHHTYLALLATLHPEMVYEYLSTHDNYRTEEALRLCEAHDIADASAYLLERMGKVTNALQLILQTLETRMMSLKRAIRSLSVEMIRSQTHRSFSVGRQIGQSTSAVVLRSKHEMDVLGVRRILIVALDLCERNSGPYNVASSEPITKFTHGELWFSVLDRLINAKGFLRLSKELPEHADAMAGVLSELLHLTMERMVSSVPLSDLVRKVTSDHSGSQIGELREMVQGLLATYGFELNVFKSAITAFHDDVRLLKRSQMELQVHGGRVHSVINSMLSTSNNRGVSSDSVPRSLQQSGVLRVSGSGNATLLENEGFSAQGREGGLVGAVRRLRSRRTLMSHRKAPVLRPKTPYRGAVDINMMTMAERTLRENEADPVLYAERSVGVLGDAEHRGRLVTFASF